MGNIQGHHHISMYTKNASENNAFYKKVLGLRRVKISVNQDNPTMYHLFYGDTTGSPGTELTFFEMPRVGQTHRGTNSYRRIGLLVPTVDSLYYWKKRFEKLKVTHGEIQSYSGREALTFEDPEGLPYVLQVSQGDKLNFWEAWSDSDVPVEHQIMGMSTIEIAVSDLDAMAKTLTDLFHFTEVKREENEALFQAIEGEVFGEILVKKLDGPSERPGRGSVHHLALRVQNDEDLVYFDSRIKAKGFKTTGIVDRYYFKSLYFTDPSGIVFEIATDGPGFTVDSSVEELGQTLDLPPFLEDRRSEIEAHLKPIEE